MKLSIQMALSGVMLCLLTSCQSSPSKDNTYRGGEPAPQTLVDDKYSLSADRKQLDELRQQVPADKKQKNDELAFVLGLMAEVKVQPSEIRNKFDSVLRKKRDLFSSDLQKERENFTKDERKKREVFLETQKKTREDFTGQKRKKEERDEFFGNQEETRKSFFENEREKRADFESDLRERRKSFEDYTREKTDEFNQELRAYTKRFDEVKKQEREKQQEKYNLTTPSSSSYEVKSLEAELLQGMGIPATLLESGE